MKRLLTEPLVHFFVLGAALWIAIATLPEQDRPAADEIVVSAGRIEHLAAVFARTWQRPPSNAEIEGLINDYVRQEAAYREGLALGLDRNDTVIRRRVRLKLEFIAEDLATQAEPGDEELAAYLAAHPDDFRIETRASFSQVYLNSEQRGDSTDADARDLLARLNSDPTIDASTVGDRLLIEHSFGNASMRNVASQFGQQFATAIENLEPGTWHGPIGSGYGLHLVFIDNRREGRLPRLDEVRDQVRREWANARRNQAIDAFYAEILDKYEIVIEWPDLPSEDETP